MNTSYFFQSLAVYPHHVKKSVCGSRAKYRDGRKDSAVKVYTVNQESIYLLINNVSAVGAAEDLRALCDQYGIVSDFRPLDDYPTEEYTEAYLVKYSSFPSARIAKKQLDDKSFFGNNLHVCYAPEFETIFETKLKLEERRKYIAWKTNTGKKSQAKTVENTQSFLSNKSQVKCSSSLSSGSLTFNQQPETYIWAGKEYAVQPQKTIETVIKSVEKPQVSGLFVPRQCNMSSGLHPSKLVSNRSLNQMPTSSTTPQTTSLATEISSYQNTISQVRAKISSVSVPNVRVSLKRKKRI